MRTDWTAWLGPAADELDEEQRDRFDAHAERIVATIHADLPEDREAAMSAVVQHLLAEVTIDQAGAERAETRRAERAASIVAQQHALLAIEDGMPEAEAARRAGLDRMTVRKLLGKR